MRKLSACISPYIDKPLTFYAFIKLKRDGVVNRLGRERVIAILFGDLKEEFITKHPLTYLYIFKNGYCM